MSQNNTVPAGLPMQTRALPVHSVDVEKRTVDVVFTTGAAVRRRRWTGWDTSVPFDEILTVSREAVNLDRLNAGAPALDSHSVWSTFSQIGVVENARIEGGKGLATIRFPSKGTDEAADRMFAMVSEGIIRNISVGYSIEEVRIEQAEKPGSIERRIVTRWTPHELSFVTVPADKDAQVRAAEQLTIYPFALQGRGIELDAPASAHSAMRTRMRMQQRARDHLRVIH